MGRGRSSAITTLKERYQRDQALLRERLTEILPQKIARDETVFEFVDVILSFDMWRRLRPDLDGIP